MRKNISLATTIWALVMAAILLLPSSGVVAVPPDGDLASKSQQAAEIAREIDTLDRELAVYAESYNRVKDELDQISEKVGNTRQRLYEIKQNLKERRELLNQRVAVMYKNGRTSMLEVILRTKDFADFLERADYVARVTESDSRLIKRIKGTRDSISAVERELADEQRQQAGLVQQASAKKNMVQFKLNERRRILSSINQEIQDLLAEERAKQKVEDVANEKEALEILIDAPESGLAKTAMRYLGVPYHWAGAGPGRCPTGEHRICFDCSGLTMYVYKLFGIDLPHNAAMQFNRGAKITQKQARAGDLVFFGTPPHHVGMYLGSDMFLHAPQTGDVVKVSRLSSRSDVSGMCRYSKSDNR